MRSLLGSGRTAGATAHRAKRSIPRGRYGSLTAAARTASRTGPPTVAGRWSLLPPREADPTVRAHALARTLLDRHGVVTRGAVSAEGVEGGFSATYRILSAFEDSGQARRGYVVEGLGAAQFAMDGAVDRLRAVSNARDRGEALPETGAPDLWSPDSVPDGPHSPAQGDPSTEDWDWTRAFDAPAGPDSEAGPHSQPSAASPASRDEYISPRDYPPQAMPQHWQGTPTYGSGFGNRRQNASDASRAVVLAAADPANAYGAALPWPDPPTEAGHKPGRKAGSLVVLVDGELTLYMERGGKTLLAWPSAPDTTPSDDPRLRTASEALAAAAKAGSLGTVTVERINGTSALTSPWAPSWRQRASSPPHGAYAYAPDPHTNITAPAPAADEEQAPGPRRSRSQDPERHRPTAPSAAPSPVPPLTHARRRHRLAIREAPPPRPRGQSADPQRPEGAEIRHGRPHRPQGPGRHPPRQAPPHPRRGRPDPALPPPHGRLLEGLRGGPALDRRPRPPDPRDPGQHRPRCRRLPAPRPRTAPHRGRAQGRRSPRPRPPRPGLGSRARPRQPAPGPRPPLGEALLDQRNLAGIGNVYKSELCFLLGVTPWLPVGALPADRAAQLPALAKKLLEANRDRPVRNTTGRRGQDLFVYGRAPRPCLRCRTSLQVADQGDGSRERPTYWCPTCQIGPAPSPRRRAPGRTHPRTSRRTTN